MAVIGLWIAGALLAISILAIIISGIRGIFSGNLDGKKVGVMLIPVVIWVVALLVTSSWIKSGILTMLIMLGLMVVSIVLTGVRGAFN